MGKEVKLSLGDLYTGYICAAALMYVIGGAAYFIGKTKAKIEITNHIKEALTEHNDPAQVRS